jgi:hypothetical protein
VDEHRRFWTFDEFYKPVRDIKGGYVGLAEYLLKHPYYPRAKFITADPSMFNKSQNILVSKENNQKSYGTLMSVVDLLEKEGIYKFQRANNDRIAGLSRMNSMFNFRGEGSKAKPYIFIGKKCNKAWWELNNLVYKLDDSETKNPEEDIVKRNDHAYDSIRYALMSENLPAEVVHDERAGFATLKAVEDEMEEDYAKKNASDVFSCKFNELDGESEWDMRDYG